MVRDGSSIYDFGPSSPRTEGFKAPLRLSLSKPGRLKNSSRRDAEKKGGAEAARPAGVAFLPGIQNQHKRNGRQRRQRPLAPLRPLRSLREPLKPRHLTQGPLGPGLRRGDGLGGVKAPLRLSLSKPDCRNMIRAKAQRSRKGGKNRAAAGVSNIADIGALCSRNRQQRRERPLAPLRPLRSLRETLETPRPCARPTGPRPAPG